MVRACASGSSGSKAAISSDGDMAVLPGEAPPGYHRRPSATTGLAPVERCFVTRTANRETNSIPQDALEQQTIVEEVLAAGHRLLPGKADVQAVAASRLQACGHRHQVVALDAARAQVEEAVALAERLGRALVAIHDPVEPVDLDQRVEPAE